MAYTNAYTRYRMPSWDLDKPLSTPTSGSLGGALSAQQPTTPGISSNTFMGSGTIGTASNTGTANPYAFGTPEAAEWTRLNVGDVQQFSGRTSPRTTTDASVLNTPPDAAIGDRMYFGGSPTFNEFAQPPGTTSTGATSPTARDTRYAASQSALGVGAGESLGRATALNNVMASAPAPGVPPAAGSSTVLGAPGYPNVNSTGPAGPGPGGPGAVPPTGLPTRGTELDDPMSRLDDNLRFPQQSITPTEVMMDPGFKWQQEQLGRRLEDIFAAKGRTGSTDYFNALTNANQKLISDEYNRINNQQWERGMEMNRLLYDRRAQENITNYEREFRENERKYGREQAEQILAYERAFREDARDYERLRFLVQLGFGATQASGGT